MIDVELTKFVGRAMPYAEQTNSGAYMPVYKDITAEVLEDHTNGRLTLGSYVIKDNGDVNYIVIDVDQDETITVPLDNPLYNLSQVIYNNFKDFERCLEYSGRRGYHIWLFLDKPEKPKFFRRLVKARLLRLGLLNIEIYPKQDDLSNITLGNLIKIPCGIHKKSGQRSFIINYTKKEVL